MLRLNSILYNDCKNLLNIQLSNIATVTKILLFYEISAKRMISNSLQKCEINIIIVVYGSQASLETKQVSQVQT